MCILYTIKHRSHPAETGTGRGLQLTISKMITTFDESQPKENTMNFKRSGRKFLAKNKTNMVLRDGTLNQKTTTESKNGNIFYY